MILWFLKPGPRAVGNDLIPHSEKHGRGRYLGLPGPCHPYPPLLVPVPKPRCGHLSGKFGVRIECLF